MICRPIAPVVLIAVILPAARASSPPVSCWQSGPAMLGGNVTLTCSFLASMDVLQVTWQRKSSKDPQSTVTNMVTHSEMYGVKVAAPFRKYISVPQASAANSSIRISKLEKEDEARYICLFNVHPNGAHAGELCLTVQGPINEVMCSARGSHLNVDLDPPEIQTRQSVSVTELRDRHTLPLKREGQYSASNINPTCAFQIPRARRQKRNSADGRNSQSEGAEEVIAIQCSAVGLEKPAIIWHNEGAPISQEDKINQTGSVITVTSTRHYNVSSFPDTGIFCNMSHGPAKTIKPLSMEVVTEGLPVPCLRSIVIPTPEFVTTKGQSRDHASPPLGAMLKKQGCLSHLEISMGGDDTSPYSTVRMISVLMAMAVVIAVVVWIVSSTKRKAERVSPEKACNGEAGHVTPSRINQVEMGPATPKFLLTLANMAEVTPSNCTNISREATSSIKKRYGRSEKPATRGAAKRLY